MWELIGWLEVEPTSSSAAILRRSAVVKLHFFFRLSWWLRTWLMENRRGRFFWVSEPLRDLQFECIRHNISHPLSFVLFCWLFLDCRRSIWLEMIGEGWNTYSIHEGIEVLRGSHIFRNGRNSLRWWDRSLGSILKWKCYLKSLLLSKPLRICSHFYCRRLRL